MKGHLASIQRYLDLWVFVVLAFVCLSARVHGADITISNYNDLANGDVSSPESLIFNPGADGISLREALLAANNAPGPHTIRFSAGLKGAIVTLQGALPEITRDGITIQGDTDGDNIPDITIDGTWSSNAPFRIKASSITVSAVIIRNFTESGVQVATGNDAPHVVERITIERNRITSGWNGIHVVNRANSGSIRDVVIYGNTLLNNGFSGIALGGGNEPFSGNNLIRNVSITENTITNTGNKLSVMIFGATQKGGSDNIVRDVTIARNTMSDLLLISGGNALGCQRNRVENVVIAENSIQVSPMAIEILGGAQDSANPAEGESTDVSGNVVTNVQITGNTLQGGGIQLVGADGQYRAPQYLAFQNSVENVVIERNLIGGCTASSAIQFQGGSHGGQNNTVRWVTIRNNVLVKNQNGAGISLLGGFERSNNNTITGIDIINNTIAENGNGWAGGININDNNDSSGNMVTGVRIKNTILWGNQRGDAVWGPISPDLVEFSIVGDERYKGKNGNFYSSPQFADPGNSDYRLGQNSPAIDAGNPLSSGAGEIDFDEETRIYDGNLDGNPVIDIGAFELHQDVLSLSAGWNFVSFPKLPGDKSVATVLADLLQVQKVRIIWGYDNAEKRWLRFRAPSPGHPAEENSLMAIGYSAGYWIYLDQPGVIQFSGWEPPASTNVTLSPGWNLVGYTGKSGRTIAEALNRLSGGWSNAWLWEKGEWKATGRATGLALPVPPFSTLAKERAYWIRVIAGSEWVQ